MARDEDKTRILFLSANPRQEKNIQVINECNEIKDEIENAQFEDKFAFSEYHGISRNKIIEQLEKHRPHIVHFSGHGNVDDLVFQNSVGNREDIGSDEFANLFKFLNDRDDIFDDQKIRCVVLNACLSISTAEKIIPFVDCVIGNPHSIDDEQAIAFGKHFYKYLCNGENIQKSFDGAKNKIVLEFKPKDNEIPNILSKNKANLKNISLHNPNKSKFLEKCDFYKDFLINDAPENKGRSMRFLKGKQPSLNEPKIHKILDYIGAVRITEDSFGMPEHIIKVRWSRTKKSFQEDGKKLNGIRLITFKKDFLDKDLQFVRGILDNMESAEPLVSDEEVSIEDELWRINDT